MIPIHAQFLLDRQFMIVSGADAASFLQGLITQDVKLLAKNGDTESGARILYTAALNPKGRYLFDFFILPHGQEGFLLDVAASQAPQLHKHLSLFKLRSAVHLDRIDDPAIMTVAGLWCEGQGGTVMNDTKVPDACVPDPRWTGLGWRLYGSRHEVEDALRLLSNVDLRDEGYALHILKNGIPTTEAGLVQEKTIPLEANFEHLNAISWTKGCYMGQELTARTHHQGLVRKRILPFHHEGCLDLPDGTGSVLCQVGNYGLARVYLEHLASLKPLGFSVPPWLRV